MLFRSVCFDEAWPRSVPVDLDGLPIRVISLEDLLANKRASGRPKDVADAATLEELASKRGKGSPRG